ncbi:MOS1T transposase, partial [Pseudoatta argentina]
MMLMQEPGWKLERKGSGAQVLRKDGSHFKSSTARVCFRCDVEIREFVPDEDYGVTENMEMETAASPLAMLSSCVAALCVTILLPWLLIGADRRFHSYEEAQKWIDSWIASKDMSFFRRGIHVLPERWEKVVSSDGQYFK